jgi:hypothetical protein
MAQNSAARRKRRLPLLLTQRNIEEAARDRHAKVSEFEAAHRKARRAAFHQCIARLQQTSSAAVSTLLKVLIDPNTPAARRVRAADSILDHSAKAIEIEDIEVLVAELEAAAQKAAQIDKVIRPEAIRAEERIL